MNRYAIAAVMIVGLSAQAQAQTGAGYLPPPDPARQEPARQVSVRRTVTEGGQPTAGSWRGGTGVGFYADTPDDAAVALMGDMDYGVSQTVSVGPMAQIGLTGDMFLLGLSGGAKYWLPVADEARLVFQGGLGLVHADVGRDDTSWLIPLGVGYDYTLSNGNNLTATALVNFTDLDARGNTDVMPAFLLGLRF